MTTITLSNTRTSGLGLGTFVERLRASLHRRAEYRRVYDELSSLSDRDLADLGIARFAISTIAKDAARAA